MSRVTRYINRIPHGALWAWGIAATCLEFYVDAKTPVKAPEPRAIPSVPSDSRRAIPSGDQAPAPVISNFVFPENAPELALADGGTWRGEIEGIPVLFQFLSFDAGTVGADSSRVQLWRLGAGATYGKPGIVQDAAGRILRLDCEAELIPQEIDGPVYRFIQRGNAEHTAPGVVPDSCLDGDAVTFEKQSSERAQMTWTRRDGLSRGTTFLRYEPRQD